jgi:hypothetical protein
MMKKLVIAAAVAATLGVAALSSTSAFAFWPGHGWYPHHGWHPYPGPIGFYPGGPFRPCHFVWYPFPHKVCRFIPF